MSAACAAAALAVLAGLASVGPRLAWAQDDGAAASRWISELHAAERSQAPERIAFRSVERRGALKAKESDAELRARVAGELPLISEGTVLAAPEGWLKDARILPAGVNAIPMRSRIASRGGELRRLLEFSEDGMDDRSALVAPARSASPGDALLGRGTAAVLEGLRWTRVTELDRNLVLTGTREGEEHELRLVRDGRPELRGWRIRRSLRTADGRPFQQRYDLTYRPAAEGSPAEIEEWMLSEAPVNSVVYRTTEIRERRPLTSGTPSLALPLPGGTAVTDLRGAEPAAYELLRALDVSRMTLGEGERMVEWSLPDDRGGRVQSSSHLGGPLLMVWLLPESPGLEQLAGTVKKLSREGRKQGLRIVALSPVAGADDPGELERLRKLVGAPVLLDRDARLLERLSGPVAAPKAVLVDRAGTIRRIQTGLSDAVLRRMVEDLPAAPDAAQEKR
ncbi:MAG: TlpA family protein disulfide reductase [Armatimonadota bacterium]